MANAKCKYKRKTADVAHLLKTAEEIGYLQSAMRILHFALII
jgi:hypothetical protein